MRSVELMVGAFYNPHLGRELAGATGIDHLAMADPPAASDPWWPAIRGRYTLLLHDYLGQLSEPLDERSIQRARALEARLDQPLVMENIPGFFDVKASQMPEPIWLRRFFEATGAGFLLDLPHVWLEAHYHDMAPERWLAEFPLEHVVELHVAGVADDRDLGGPWIAPVEPSDEMLAFAAHAVSRCPRAEAVTFDAFAPSLTTEVLFRTVERIRGAL